MHPDSSCTVTLFISQPKGRSATRARTHALFSRRALMPDQGNQVNWYQAVWSVVLQVFARFPTSETLDNVKNVFSHTPASQEQSILLLLIFFLILNSSLQIMNTH